MNNIFICKICNKEFNSVHALSLHLKLHNISAEEYYKKYLLKPGEGTCKVCGKPTKYHSLSKGFYTYCCNDCIGKDKEIVKKREETSIKRFGVKHASELEKYKEKAKQTYKEKTGYDHNMHNPEVVEKVKNSLKNSDIAKAKNKINGINYSNNAKNEFIKFIEPYNLTLIEYNKKESVKIKCNICNNIMETRTQFIYQRIKKSLCPCSFCQPKPTQTSFRETEFKEYIKSIYHNTLLENDRNILKGKEIDIYLPDLKLGLEFDGIYWHADSRFYKEDEIIYRKGLSAKQIWEKDETKNKLAESIGIKLIRIKEYDWINDNDNIKKYILEILSTN